MGQCADRDVIDARFGEAAHGLQGDTARRFERNAAVHNFYRPSSLLGFEIVQKDDIGAAVNGGSKLVERSDLHFDLHEMTEIAACFLNCMRNGGMEDKVIIFDVDTVEQANSVIYASYAGYGVIVQYSVNGLCI